MGDWSLSRRAERYGDREFRRFLRRWQWRALLKGRKRATEQIEMENAHTFRRESSPEHTPVT